MTSVDGRSLCSHKVGAELIGCMILMMQDVVVMRGLLDELSVKTQINSLKRKFDCIVYIQTYICV